MAVVRRQACTLTVVRLWDTIAFIKQQRQVPTFERMLAYMKRTYNIKQDELQLQIKYAVSDGLIIAKRCKKATRGFSESKKTTYEHDTYLVPDEIKEKDDHDWYCFVCHTGGEVILCTKCHRVYHEKCVAEVPKDEAFVCDVCEVNPTRFEADFKKSDLNTLLGFTCVRLKEKTREMHRIPHRDDDDKRRLEFLIYENKDLLWMEDKMRNNEYLSLGDFYTDAQQIAHNVMVYFGVNTRLAAMALQMMIDCEYDLNEIIQCASCYKMSNMKHDAYWFCTPCNPPHELVYAKQKGYPFWPAKVIKKEVDFYDVRFFGAFHQRAFITYDYVKPISTSYKDLGIKKTESFVRAFKELSRHQDLVKKQQADLANNSGSSMNLNNNKVEIEAEVDSKPRNPITRKRKSITTIKPPPKKRASLPKKPPTATVPVKKNKKFYQDSPTSSSPKNASSASTVIPEDQNLVSSSSQETTVFQISTEVQTDELSKTYENQKNPSVEVQVKEVVKPCECKSKYEKQIKDLRDSLKSDFKEEKSKALKEIADKVRKEMEEEKHKCVEVALEKQKLDQKVNECKTKLEWKAEREKELSQLMEQHSRDISEVKKKQWCYNCENEAIYHCCWNTSYCSVECQQNHWHKEHKRTCRRKR